MLVVMSGVGRGRSFERRPATTSYVFSHADGSPFGIERLGVRHSSRSPASGPELRPPERGTKLWSRRGLSVNAGHPIFRPRSFERRPTSQVTSCDVRTSPFVINLTSAGVRNVKFSLKGLVRMLEDTSCDVRRLSKLLGRKIGCPAFTKGPRWGQSFVPRAGGQNPGPDAGASDE